MLVLCTTLVGAEDFVEMVHWGRTKLDFLRRFLSFERGVPSHDTLGDVVSALDPQLFKAAFADWVEALRDAAPDIVAIDDKTSRRCHDRARGRSPLHMVSAWASRQRLVLGQEAVDAKSNETTAIPLLLERLELTGALVTIDAIGTQSAIAETIVARSGDYLLALKGNRPALLRDVADYFADPPADMILPHHVTTDAGHERIEERRHSICYSTQWLFSDRRYPDEPHFPHLAMIAMVESHVERDGRKSSERRYYLSSATKPSPPPCERTGESKTASTGPRCRLP